MNNYSIEAISHICSWCTSDEVLWRGIKLDISEQMKTNSSITWWQISSCSKQAKIAGGFGGFSLQSSSSNSVRSILAIETNLAKNITNHSFFTLEIYSIVKDSSTTIYHLRDCTPPKQLLLDSFPNTNQFTLPKGRK